MLHESRMRIFSIAVILAAAFPAAGALVATPAIAKPGPGADAGAVINACDRAKYCVYSQDPKTGALNGCDVQTGTCFTCPPDGSHKCYQTRQAPTGKPGTGEIGGISLAPAPREYHPPVHIGVPGSPAGKDSIAEGLYGRSTGPTNPAGPDIPAKKRRLPKQILPYRQ